MRNNIMITLLTSYFLPYLCQECDEQANTENQDLDQGLLIGIISGSVGGLIIIIIVLIIVCKKGRGSELQENQVLNQGNDEMEKKNFNGDIPTPISPIINRSSDNVSNKSLSITERPLYDKKIEIEEMDSFSREPYNRRAQDNEVEKNFKEAIINLESKEDKMHELVKHSPKYEPNKINLSEFEQKVEEKTTKDIMINNIYNYTEDNRDQFYSEGSKKSYAESIDYRNSIPENNKQNRNSIELIMTPQEVMDFHDETPANDNIYKYDNYHSSNIQSKNQKVVHKKMSLE